MTAAGASLEEAERARAPRPDSGRRERTRQAILAAAFELIGHARGLSVRIEEICARARISRGSFYNYFTGLEELFAELSYSISHRFVLAVRDDMAAMSSAAEQCDAGLRHYLLRARQDAAWGWAMVHLGAMGPLFGAETSASAEQTIAEGIARGEFTIVDASVGRDLVLGTAHAAILTHLRAGSAPDMPYTASRSVLRGLGVRDDLAEAIARRPLRAL